MHFIYDKNGTRRKAINIQCANCNKEFLTRVNSSQKFCSRECASSSRAFAVNLTCALCKKAFQRKESQTKQSRSGIFFCGRACKESAQRQSIFPEIMPNHYGCSIRAKLNTKFDNKCSGCFENREYLLQIHHIDGNNKNNADDNLELVCGRCHVVRHLKITKSGFRHITKALTPRDLVKHLDSISRGEKQNTFDSRQLH